MKPTIGNYYYIKYTDVEYGGDYEGIGKCISREEVQSKFAGEDQWLFELPNESDLAMFDNTNVVEEVTKDDAKKAGL